MDKSIREKFESWAELQGYNLIRHSLSPDYYNSFETSTLWKCWMTAFKMGSEQVSNVIILDE